jgi:hypothetical protein
MSHSIIVDIVCPEKSEGDGKEAEEVKEVKEIKELRRQIARVRLRKG